jgi:hypothetical protein
MCARAWSSVQWWKGRTNRSTLLSARNTRSTWASAHQHDPFEAELLSELVDRIGHGGRISRVALVDVDARGPALAIGQDAVDDDRQPPLSVAAMAEPRQRAMVSFVETAGDVVEGDTPSHK